MRLVARTPLTGCWLQLRWNCWGSGSGPGARCHCFVQRPVQCSRSCHGGVDDPDPVASQLRGVFEQDMADSAVCTGRSCCPVGWARGLLGRPCHSSSHGSSHGSIWPDDPHDPFGFRLRVAFDDQAMADAAFCVADSACG